jgi:hypothetical protein
MGVGFALFEEVRVILFGEVRFTFFGEVCLALVGEVRVIFFGGRLGLFATALVALCRMSLRSLRQPSGSIGRCLVLSVRTARKPKHNRSLSRAIDAGR